MKKFRWVLLLSLLLVIFTTIGCGSQTTQSSKAAAQNQSSTDPQSATKDGVQTQSKSDSQSTTKDNAQNQTNTDPQSAAQDSVQTQAKSNTQSTKDNGQTQSKSDPQSASKDVEQPQNNTNTTPTVKKNPLATITMASGDQIKVELYPDVAPNTVKSFISLVQKGFYNGLIFHRVIPGFMIQGGDPNGNGTGGPGYSIKGEFTNNGFTNNLKHERGVISMGRTQDPNSAGSQFFIMVASAPSLDKNYAAFGKVLSGMDAVDKIVNSPRDKMDKPLQSQVMKSVTVDTFGVNYGEPSK